MNHQPNKYFNWLMEINGKTVDKIYQVDFNNDRHEDVYLPWFYFITFLDFHRVIEIEGDFDGNHIKLNFCDTTELKDKLVANHLPDEPDLWHVYETEQNEVLGQLLGQKIEFVEYGIDKDNLEMNNALMRDQKDVLYFIRFHSTDVTLSIFEGSATGLGVSDDPKIELDFEDVYDIYNTKAEGYS